jgi:uncharacterized protein YndB with AHSA1/START domain
MPDILHSIQIARPADRVFPLVSTAEGLRQWWASDVRGDGPDAPVEIGFFEGSTVYRLAPELREAPRVMRWRCETGAEWKGTLITFRLMDNASGGTTVRFNHSDWRERTDYFVDCNTTWGGLMFRLRSAAEGHGAGPLFLADRLAD